MSRPNQTPKGVSFFRDLEIILLGGMSTYNQSTAADV